MPFLGRWMGYHGIFLLMALARDPCTHGSSRHSTPKPTSLPERAAPQGVQCTPVGWRSVGRGRPSPWSPVVSSATRQESRSPEGGAREETGRKQLPSNKQQLEKVEAEGNSVAHHRGGEKERTWALMRSSLDLKKGSKSAPCHQTVGIKDESGLMGSGCQGFTRQTLLKGLYSPLSAAEPSFLGL